MGAELQFIGFSSGAEGLFSNLGGNGAGSQGGLITFYDSAKGGNGTFTNEGGVGAGAPGAEMVFADTSSAENATLIAHGGVAGGGGATIKFIYSSTGGNARVELFGNGALDIHLASGPVSVGSLEGDGSVSLGANNLTVGGNGFDRSFAGAIEGAGSLSKIGRGTLTLTGSSTYTGGTSVNHGILSIENATGFPLGTGPVRVNHGVLRGAARVAGQVTCWFGGRATRDSFCLAPIKVPIDTITIQRKLRFRANGNCYLSLDSSTLAADRINARGVTIESTGTFISIGDISLAKLPIGTTFLFINNTASTPIAGTFANLSNGGTLAIGSNTFQANYEGGDGNDLTLTVVP